MFLALRRQYLLTSLLLNLHKYRLDIVLVKYIYFYGNKATFFTTSFAVGNHVGILGNLCNYMIYRGILLHIVSKTN